MADFTISATFDITKQQVADLVVTALEGGSNDWLGGCEPPYMTRKDYANADNYGDRMVHRTFSVDEDEETYVFDRIAIRRGLALMANQFPTAFKDLVEDNADAETADIFMQCALLGDVVYG